MLILTIDSSMGACSAGVYDKTSDKMISESFIEMPRGQAEHLIPMINQVIDEANMSYDQLDQIAVTKGPGAFTGMRIGLSAAKGLGVSLEIPVVGVSTFDAVLGSVKAEADVTYGILLETKRQDFYFQMFEGDMPITDGVAESAQNIVNIIEDRRITFIGDVWERFQCEANINVAEYEHIRVNAPSPISVARQSMRCSVDDGTKQMPEPVYIRAPDVSFSKRPIRKISGYQATQP